jgi:hypothetical protein
MFTRASRFGGGLKSALRKIATVGINEQVDVGDDQEDVQPAADS